MTDVLAPGMEVVDHLISPEHASRIVEWLKEGDKFGAGDGCTVDHYILPFVSYANPDFIDSMHRAVDEAVLRYAEAWGTQFSQQVPKVHYNRYLPNEGHLDEHYDLDERGQPYHISAVLYLNDDFDEGETYFSRLGAHIIPAPGKLAIFPSAFVYAHSALRPQNGTKYAVAFWFWH